MSLVWPAAIPMEMNGGGGGIEASGPPAYGINVTTAKSNEKYTY